MRQRLISAAVLVPVVVVVFLIGDPWLSVGIALLAGFAAFEASRLVRGAGLGSDDAFVVIVAVAAVLLTRVLLEVQPGFGAVEATLPARYLFGAEMLSLAAIPVLVAGLLALRHHEPRTGFLAWSGNVLAALYASLLALLAGLLVVAPEIPDHAVLAGVLDAGRIWILVLVVTVWSFDSFAYVAGKYHGRGRFMNHISPNKTWSGVVGGTAAALVACTLLVWAAGQSPVAGMLLGLLIAVAAQAGDLAESILKRAAGAKDSGNLIPGHGGILDRVDSFMFAAPALFIAVVCGAGVAAVSEPTRVAVIGSTGSIGRQALEVICAHARPLRDRCPRRAAATTAALRRAGGAASAALDRAGQGRPRGAGGYRDRRRRRSRARRDGRHRQPACGRRRARARQGRCHGQQGDARRRRPPRHAARAPPAQPAAGEADLATGALNWLRPID